MVISELEWSLRLASVGWRNVELAHSAVSSAELALAASHLALDDWLI